VHCTMRKDGAQEDGERLEVVSDDGDRCLFFIIIFPSSFLRCVSVFRSVKQFLEQEAKPWEYISATMHLGSR
jgi:hypothetical protein